MWHSEGDGVAKRRRGLRMQGVDLGMRGCLRIYPAVGVANLICMHGAAWLRGGVAQRVLGVAHRMRLSHRISGCWCSTAHLVRRG